MNSDHVTRPRTRELLLGVMLASLVGGAWLSQPSAPEVMQRADAADSVRERPRPNVKVMKPFRRDLARMTRAVASVMPYREVDVYSLIPGVVAADPAPVEVGTRVRAGDTLCMLAAPDLDARVTTAKSVRAQVKAQALKLAAGVLEAEQAVPEAEQGVLEATAMARKAQGAVTIAQAKRERASAEVAYRKVVYERLQAVLAGGKDLIARQKVDEAKGFYEMAIADVRVAEAGIDDARQTIKVAEARIEAAKARVTAAKAHVEAAEAAVQSAAEDEKVAAARVAEAKVLTNFTEVKAPFAGVVTRRMVDVGSLVKDGGRNSGAQPLFHIVNDDKLRIQFPLAAPDAPHCRAGRRVEIRIDEIKDPDDITKPRIFKATVTRVADALHARTRTMEAEVELDNVKDQAGQRLLRTGMFARVMVWLETYPQALVLPTRAVQTRKHKSNVMVVRPDGTVNKVKVKIGADDGHLVRILDGVTEADSVITAGMNLVADGEKANPTMDEYKSSVGGN